MNAITNIAQIKAGEATPSHVISPVTVITGSRPAVLSKSFSLTPEGKLHKSGGGMLAEGKITVVTVEGLSGLAKLLPTLTASQALIYGVPVDPAACMVVSKQELEGSLAVPGHIARTKEAFDWPEGAGFMMLDYDPEPDAQPLTRDQLVSALRAAVPGLGQCQMLWWMSASSGLYHGDKELRGVMGQRLWLHVAEAADIPRAGQVLAHRLWLAGHGTIRVSSSGQMLERTLVDTAVWQQNRLDFAGGANCAPPLRQDRGAPVLIPGQMETADTRQLLPDLTEAEQASLTALRQAARAGQSALASERRAAWEARRRAEVIAQASGAQNTGPDDAQIAGLLEAALCEHELRGGYVIQVQIGKEISPVSVEAILANPRLYHGRLCRDPLEPDYRDGALVGKLFTTGTAPCLHSFARGETVYKLTRSRIRVDYATGGMSDLVSTIVGHLRHSPRYYDYGDHLALVDRGRLDVLNEHSLAQQLGLEFSCYKTASTPGQNRPEATPRAGRLMDRLQAAGQAGGQAQAQTPPTECEIPQTVARRIIEMRSRRGLREISGVITAPTIRPDGSILDTPGYDPETQLYLDPQGPCWSIPASPTLDEAKSALGVLMKPFSRFPFVTVLDRAAHLSALLTAIVRPVLDTAPAFAYDAPQAGSGKTLLASCVTALAEGKKPSVWPHIGREEEVRKRLLTALMSGARGMIWDNITGEFDSPSMAALLTGSSFVDRVLGQSQAQSIPNRLLLTLSGNNLVLTGDLMRRVITCRINPGVSEPYARVFEQDPLQICLSQRQRLVAAACTLIRARQLLHPEPVAPGRLAAFEAWDHLVRQTVAWAGEVLLPGYFGDPMDLIRQVYEQDGELQSLGTFLYELTGIFGSRSFSAKEVLARMHSQDLQHAAEDLGGEKALVSPLSMGRLLRRCVDRPVQNLRLVSRKGTGNTLAYAVRTAGAED